jgi:hypothetical protein
VFAFDIETYQDPVVITWLPAPEAPSNYKKQEAIDAYVAEATATRNAKLALHPATCRIVSIGWTVLPNVAAVTVCPDVDVERAALEAFWRHFAAPDAYPVGFNCVGFDLPVLVTRSLLMGVTHPRLSLRKYGSPDCTDLMLDLSQGGVVDYKGLDFWCQRFGLDVPKDATTGKDIAALVEAGDWAGVEAHNRADVIKTYALARRVYPALCADVEF